MKNNKTKYFYVLLFLLLFTIRVDSAVTIHLKGETTSSYKVGTYDADQALVKSQGETLTAGMTSIDFTNYYTNVTGYKSVSAQMQADHGLTMDCTYGPSTAGGDMYGTYRFPQYQGVYYPGPNIVLNYNSGSGFVIQAQPLLLEFNAKDGSGKAATVDSVFFWFVNSSYCNAAFYDADDNLIGTYAIHPAKVVTWYGIGFEARDGNGQLSSAIHRVELTLDTTGMIYNYAGISGCGVSQSDIFYSGYCLYENPLEKLRVKDKSSFLLSPEIANVRQQRMIALNQERRIIIDNDGGDALTCTGTTIQNFLDERTSCFVGTQVDTLSYNTTRGIGLYEHNTQIGSVFVSTSVYPHNMIPGFLAQGTDPLKIVTNFCKSNGLEIFWNMRMNDTHDAAEPYRTDEFAGSNQFKINHPEYLLGSYQNPPVCGYYTGVDYTHPEVRDFLYRTVEEVCKNYNIDGIEFDFFRHPVFFKCQANGQDCNSNEWAMLNELMRDIRNMTERRSIERGRPILLLVRIPDSVDYCKAIGIDLETWLSEGLIDAVIPSDYYQLNNWEYTVNLCDKYNVNVYCDLSETRTTAGTPEYLLRSDKKCTRARAMNMLGSGANGIFVFNQPNCYSPLWYQIGDVETMNGLDKIYVTSATDFDNIPYYIQDGSRFINRQVVMPSEPISLGAGESTTVKLDVFEDMNNPGTATLKLKLRFLNSINVSDVSVSINGNLLATGTFVSPYIEFLVNKSYMIFGWNDVEISSASANQLIDLYLNVDYPGN
jgi:hypothetical protein